MKRLSWDGYFIKAAHLIAERATCPRKHVGAVLTRDDRILAAGYNGSLPGLPHCEDVGCDLVNGHCVRTIHAEVNAVLSAARQGTPTVGAMLYCTASPCLACFKLVAAAGIKRIVYPEIYGEPAAFMKMRDLAHLMRIDLVRHVG